MIYLLPLLGIICSILVFDISRKFKFKQEVFKILVFILTLISAFQYGVGSDTPVYMVEFNNSSWKDFETLNILQLGLRQFGWVLLINTIKTIFGSYFILQTCVAILVNYSFGHFFWKHSKYPFTALLIYFFSLYFDLNFNVLRQGIAIAFFLLSIDAYFTKKWHTYYFYCIIAVLFHSSAIILLALPFIRFFSNGVKYILLLLCSLLIGGPILFNLLSNFLNNVFVSDYIDSYVNSSVYGLSEATFFQSFVTSSVRLLVLIWLLKKSIFKNYKLLPLLCFYCVLLTFASKLIIIGRLTKYFIPFVILYEVDISYNIPKYIISSKKIPAISKLRILGYAVLICLSLSLPIRQLMHINKSFNAPNYIQYYPYSSVFTKEIPPIRRQFQI